MYRARVAAGIVLMLVACGARADDDAAQTYLSENGCVVGPQERMSPETSGYYPRLREMAQTALAEGQAEQQRDWIVLGPEACTILPPVINSAYDITSPVVQRGIGAIDAHAEYDVYGCFISGEDMQRELMSQENLTADAAVVAYIGVLADGVRSGQVSFFSDDPLRTPIGFQVLTGVCADVPDIAEIRRSQVLMLEHFDTLVRDNATRVACDAEGNTISVTTDVAQTLAEVTDGEAVNAWVMMDMLMLALGAGWVEGTSATERGTPRPPLCSYAE